MFDPSKLGSGRGRGQGTKRITQPVHPRPAMNGVGKPVMSRPPVARGAAVKGPAASALAREERCSLVPSEKLACGMMIRLTPELQEEMKRAEARGRPARIKFGAESASDSAIEVGGKEFKFNWSSECGQCDIYEEGKAEHDGNASLLETGYMSRRLNIQRVLDESVKNRVKLRTEEAERQHKARHSIVLNPSNPFVKGSAMAVASVEGSKKRFPYRYRYDQTASKKFKDEPSQGPPKSTFRSQVSSKVPKSQSSLCPVQPSPLKSGQAQSKSLNGAAVKNFEEEEDISLDIFEKELVSCLESEECDKNCEPVLSGSPLKSGLAQSKTSNGAAVKNLEDEEDVSFEIFQKELFASLESKECNKNTESVPSAIKKLPSKNGSSHESLRLHAPLFDPDIAKKHCTDDNTTESRSAGNSKSGSSESSSDSSSQSKTSSGSSSEDSSDSQSDATFSDKKSSDVHVDIMKSDDEEVLSRPVEECEGDIDDIKIDILGDDQGSALNLLDGQERFFSKESLKSPARHEPAEKKPGNFDSQINGANSPPKLLNQVDEYSANNFDGATDEAKLKRKRASDPVDQLPIFKKRLQTKNSDLQPNFGRKNLRESREFMLRDLYGEKGNVKENGCLKTHEHDGCDILISEAVQVHENLAKSVDTRVNVSATVVNIDKEKILGQPSRTIPPNKSKTISNQVGSKRKCSADNSEDSRDPKIRRFQSEKLAEDARKIDNDPASRKESASLRSKFGHQSVNCDLLTKQKQANKIQERNLHEHKSYPDSRTEGVGKNIWDPWSDIDYSTYGTYDKDEPHVRKSIQDHSQYQEYVKEYREMYDHYCSLHKMLENIRNYFLQVGRELDLAKENDGNRYFSIVEQLRDLYHKHEANHKKLKLIFLVLHEELKDIKLRIKDYVKKQSEDRGTIVEETGT